MSEEEISEALNRVVPHREVPEGMLAGARRRRRRTQVFTGGAAATLAVALAVPFALSMGGASQQMVATPAPVTSATAAPERTSLEPDVCRDAEGNYPSTTELPEAVLPDGATRVWLCGGPSNSFMDNTHVGAPEALTLNVADAVAAFNAVPSLVGAIDCPANNSIGFTVVYEYPDGPARTVQGGLAGCEAVVSSTTYRMEAKKYLEDLRALWNEQRTVLGTVFDADVPVCSARTSVMGVGIADMTRAYACGPISNVDGSTDSVQFPLSDALVADIVKEITSQDVYSGIQPGISMDAPSLVLLSAEGDPYTIQGTPEGYRWYDPEPTGMNLWRPSPELAARLYDEMTRDGTCTAPKRLVPSDVTVDVYDAGGGEASVELVVEHLTEAGFAVTNTGEYVASSMGSAIIVRSGGTGSGAGTRLVESQFNDTSGEVSREDDVVDVLVTSLFLKATTHFASEPLKDAADGSLTCTASSASSTSSSSATPKDWPSQAPPPSVVPQVDSKRCDVDADGRMVPTDLPDNTLPDGPVAVWLCNELRPLAEPLVGKDATQQVVDSFRKLPTTTSFDSHPTPGHAYVVVAYADGQRYTVEMETRSSDKVVWGSDRQHVRYGGDEWIRALEQLWVKQRNDTPQNPPIAPTGGVCDNLYWNLGRAIDRYDEGGTLCTVIITDAGSRGFEVPTTPSLIEEARTEAQKSRTPWAPDAEEIKMQDWIGDSLVLVDDYGDRLPLILGPGGTWYWREGNDTWEWTPSPELTARLSQAFDEGRPSSQPTHS